MALLRARARARIHREPLLPRQFSSSSSSSSRLPPPPPQPASADPPPSPLADIRDLLSSTASSSRLPHPPSEPASGDRPERSAFFADFRDRLGSSASASASSPRSVPPNDDLRHKLRHFPRPPPSTPTTPPSSSAPSSSGPSFIDVFAATPHAPNRHSPSATPWDFATLRDSLSKSGPAAGGLPFPGARKLDLKTSLSQRQGRAGSEAAFGRDLGLKSGAGSIVVQREYSYDELGKRLGDLRPAGAGKDGKEWFSLEELSSRIGRLREMERAPQSGMGTDKLRAMLQAHAIQTQDQKKTGGALNMAALMGFGGQTVQGKPQEELMERYFHPDHMSSAEKMKLELKRVRDEFKMSENDCGSARVQVAQLTTKIKHLSTTLHKKDKHSRKGLQEMVQRRKKYLKYLRRTDWDSYCLVLKSLGLRDVPEYKGPDYKSKSNTKSKTKKKSKRKRKA